MSVCLDGDIWMGILRNLTAPVSNSGRKDSYAREVYAAGGCRLPLRDSGFVRHLPSVAATCPYVWTMSGGGGGVGKSNDARPNSRTKRPILETIAPFSSVSIRHRPPSSSRSRSRALLNIADVSATWPYVWSAMSRQDFGKSTRALAEFRKSRWVF